MCIDNLVVIHSLGSSGAFVKAVSSDDLEATTMEVINVTIEVNDQLGGYRQRTLQNSKTCLSVLSNNAIEWAVNSVSVSELNTRFYCSRLISKYMVQHYIFANESNGVTFKKIHNFLVHTLASMYMLTNAAVAI